MSSINHLESIDSGSNYKFGNKMEVAKPKRSLFDLGHLVTTDIPNAGEVFPVTWFPTVPGDDFDINADVLLRVMPQVVPLYSRQRLYIYGFYSRIGDLWDEANVFVTKGYSGNETSLRIPTLNNDNLATQSPGFSTIAPNSLGDDLGLPQGLSRSVVINSGINALPFMMYLRIWRDYFVNKNHYINDRVILPNDDSRFRLNSNGQLLSALDANKNFRFNIFISGIMNPFEGDYGTFDYVMGIYSHLYPSDYFTSALPFTQRGTAPTLTASLSGANVTSQINFDKALVDSQDIVTGNNMLLAYNFDLGKIGILSPNSSSTSGTSDTPILNASGTYMRNSVVASGGTHGTPYTLQNSINNGNLYTSLANALNKAEVISTLNGTAQTSVIWNDIRKLAQQQEELEKMARTDGSYGGFGITFFGERSKNAIDYKPVYIGGTYKNISFTEILQTSGSTVGTTNPNATSPLGAQAGHGIVGITNGRIGHVHCDDYGYIMLLACVMPDIYYSQGLDKKFTISKQDELYLPERARLGMIPILNKEIFFAGNNGNNQGEDNYLWAYQNPFDDLRYIQNRISGKIADYSNNSFRSYTQARHFTTLPNWGKEFAQADNVRKDYLFAPSESAYTAQFKFDIRAVRPLPYRSIPAKLM